MKLSKLFNVISIGGALAVKPAPGYPYPSLQNGVVCFSHHGLTISYYDGFTTSTSLSAVLPTSHYYPPSRGPTLPYVTVTLTTSTSTFTSTPTPTPTPTTPPTTLRTTPSTTPSAPASIKAKANVVAREASADPSAEAERPPGHRHHGRFICSFLRSDISWKSTFLVPKWLPTSALVTATLNSWITTTQLTTVDTEYWLGSSPLAAMTQPPVATYVAWEGYEGPEDEEGEDDDDDDDVDTVSYPSDGLLNTRHHRPIHHDARSVVTIHHTITETVTERFCSSSVI